MWCYMLYKTNITLSKYYTICYSSLPTHWQHTHSLYPVPKISYIQNLCFLEANAVFLHSIANYHTYKWIISYTRILSKATTLLASSGATYCWGLRPLRSNLWPDRKHWLCVLCRTGAQSKNRTISFLNNSETEEMAEGEQNKRCSAGRRGCHVLGHVPPVPGPNVRINKSPRYTP